MRNIKWILLSLLTAFIGVPILAHCVALFCGLFVAIIAYVLDGLGLAKETDGLPSALMLLAVCNLMFFGGRIWSRDNAPEDNLIWRHVILLLLTLLALLGWIYALQQAGLDFYTMGSGTLIVLSPTAENIRNEVYPWVASVYMVTQENPTAETQKVVAWFLSPQGQRLVQDVGYVPMYDMTYPK